MFSWSTQPRPMIGLSPMADMTDLPFCSVVRAVNRTAPSMPIMFREMVSSEAIVRDSQKTLAMARFDPIERPIIQQLFGSDPVTMARAAQRIMELYRPDGIDINMGCPVYKMTCHFNGAALMKEPERAMKIIREVRNAIGPIAFSVKIRLGWSEPTEAREFAQRIEQAGADLITVHGRTKMQGYSGRADWAEIGEIKKRVSIPVLANGDIVDATTAWEALRQSNADGIMIARGALGNPWVFGEIKKALSRTTVDSSSQAGMTVDLSDKIPTILQHAQLMVKHYGPHGITLFRKHLSWYVKGIPNSKELRIKLMEVKTFEEVGSILAKTLLFSPVQEDDFI